MNAIVCDSKMYVYIETVTTQGGTKNLNILVPYFRPTEWGYKATAYFFLLTQKEISSLPQIETLCCFCNFNRKA